MDECLVHDHAELGDLLAELRASLEAREVARSHAALDLFWARLAIHIRAEHLHLFPAILHALSGSLISVIEGSPSLNDAQNAIESLRRDHDFFMHELSRSIILVRESVTIADQQVAARELEAVRARVAAVAARLENHNRVEERGIYLWIGSLLSEAEQGALAGRIQEELAKMPPRFAANSNFANEN